MDQIERVTNPQYIAKDEANIIWDDNAKAAHAIGVQQGAIIGATHAINTVLPAILEQVNQAIDAQVKRALSDGLRHGSPECAKQMGQRRINNK